MKAMFRKFGWFVLCLSALFNSVHATGQSRFECRPAVMTLSEAAEFLRTPAGQLDEMVRDGEVPARQIGSEWRFSCAELTDWLASGSGVDAGALHAVRGRGTGGIQSEELPDAEPQVEGTIGEAPEEEPAEDIFLRGQRVLLGPGEVVVDLGQFYARRDSQRLVSFDDGMALTTLESETLSTLVLIRAGVFEETEVFAGATFQRQGVEEFADSIRMVRETDARFGGLSFGIRRTLVREGAGRPDVIVTFSGQVPGKDDVYAIGGGAALVKSFDPVVLFAGANFTHRFDRVFSNGAQVDGDSSVDISVGYGLSLNDTVAISAGVSAFFANDFTINDTNLRQPDSYAARFSLTSWLAEGLYIEPSVSFGLSGPDNAVAFGITLPYSF